MIALEQLSQLAEIESKSQTDTIAIFKHSTSCGISRMMLKSFQNELSGKIDFKADNIYILDLLRYREISNAIAQKWHIQHESPQLLVIRKGAVIHHSSHSSISAEALSES